MALRSSHIFRIYIHRFLIYILISIHHNEQDKSTTNFDIKKHSSFVFPNLQNYKLADLRNYEY